MNQKIQTVRVNSDDNRARARERRDDPVKWLFTVAETRRKAHVEGRERNFEAHIHRNIGDLTYVSVATTGNLMRGMEAAYSALVDKDDSARLAFRVYGTLIATFAAGAVLGAFASLYWGVRAVWVPAAFLAITLVLFIIDEREGKEP